MSCECHQIGGRFIAEDPDCPAHGYEAQRLARDDAARRERVIEDLQDAIDSEDHERIEREAQATLLYLRSL